MGPANCFLGNSFYYCAGIEWKSIILYDSKKRKIISTISIISVLKETKTDSPIHREFFFIILIKANRNQIAFTICCPFGSKKIGAWKIQSDFGMI